MSRRASNVVKLTRAQFASVGTPTDRNGIPVLDDPRHANRLVKRCVGPHLYVPVGRRFITYDDLGYDVLSVVRRCVHCGDRDVTTEVE